MSKSVEVCVALILFTTYCIAIGEAATENTGDKPISSNSSIAEKQPQYPLFYFPNDFSLKSGIGEALLIGCVAVFGLVLIGGLALFIAPAFGYKVCSLFGNCDPTLIPYSAAGNLQEMAQNSPYDSYGSYVPTNGYASYRKRSLDYVGPILKTLAAAYEKHEEKKN